MYFKVIYVSVDLYYFKQQAERKLKFALLTIELKSETQDGPESSEIGIQYFHNDIIYSRYNRVTETSNLRKFSEPLRAILKMIAGGIYQQQRFMYSLIIFVTFWKENESPLVDRQVELCRTEAPISPLCYVFGSFSFGRVGFQSYTFIHVSTH